MDMAIWHTTVSACAVCSEFSLLTISAALLHTYSNFQIYYFSKMTSEKKTKERFLFSFHKKN